MVNVLAAVMVEPGRPIEVREIPEPELEPHRDRRSPVPGLSRIGAESARLASTDAQVDLIGMLPDHHELVMRKHVFHHLSAVRNLHDSTVAAI